MLERSVVTQRRDSGAPKRRTAYGLVVVACVTMTIAAACNDSSGSKRGSNTRTLSGSGFAVNVPSGWYGRVRPTNPPPSTIIPSPYVDLGNYPLPPREGQSGSETRPANGILVSVTESSPGVAPFKPAKLPLTVRLSDFGLSLEGIPGVRSSAKKPVVVNGRYLQISVLLGAKKVTPATLAAVDRALGGIQLTSP